MLARMLSTDTIRVHAKPLAAFAVSLVFAVAALPALAQRRGRQRRASPPRLTVTCCGAGRDGAGIPSR
jgi:hypothetical protein